MNAPVTANGVWDQLFLTHYARLQHDYTLSSKMLNHINLGWNRVFVTNRNTTVGTGNIASSVGLPANATQNVAFPRIGFPGYGDTVSSADPRSYQEVGSTFFSDKQGDNTVDIADAFSWILGRHSLRIGGDFRIQQLNVTQFIDPGGSFNFRADQTGNSGKGGWPIASLITGATEFSFATIHTAQPAYRYKYPAFFVNDDFKVSQKLTLNLGVRYELPLPRTESHNYLRGFDPNAINPATGTKGALVSAGGLGAAGGLKASSSSLSSTYYATLAPRIGFAYTAHPGTVLRGGWGIFYGPLQYNSDITAGTLGYSISRVITPGADYNQSTAFLSSYPAAPAADPTSQYVYAGCGANGGNICRDVQYFNQPYRTGLTQQFSMNLQQDLTHSWTMQLGYVGHLGQRLFSGLQRPNALPFNDIRLGGPILNKPLTDVTAQDLAYAGSIGAPIPTQPYAGFTGNVAQALRRFPQYNNIQNQNESQGRDYYNSLQARLDHRFQSGLQMGASYTWAREITNAAEDIIGNNSRLAGVLQYPNAQNLRAVRTVSPDDVPHSFVINYLYELPFGRGKHYLSHGGVVNTAVGGWSINGIQRYQSGLPVLISNSNPDFANNFLTVIGVGGNIRPNLTGAPLTLGSSGKKGSQYAVLNPAAFSNPTSFNPSFTPDATGSPAYAAYFNNVDQFFGHASPVLGSVRPNKFLSEDMSVLKKTALHENLSLETGLEAFNVFNRHRYNNPSTDLNAGDFGQSSVVSGANTARVVQLRARLLF